MHWLGLDLVTGQDLDQCWLHPIMFFKFVYHVPLAGDTIVKLNYCSDLYCSMRIDRIFKANAGPRAFDASKSYW